MPVSRSRANPLKASKVGLKAVIQLLQMEAWNLYPRLQAARDPQAVISPLAIAALKMPVLTVSKIPARAARKMAVKLARGNKVPEMQAIVASKVIRPPEPEVQLVAARAVEMTHLPIFPQVVVR